MNTRQLLERLVRFPTVSRDSNLDLIEFVQAFLTARGIDSQLFLDADAKKANLFATLGPTERGGILLSGHTDVVPVDGQKWSSDPFRVVERDGALYGRGTADMKGFIAAALALVDRAARRKLREPLHLALSYDEEIGCVGVRSLIEAMAGWTVRPRICIVGEPTLMRAAVGHKGKAGLKATCCGHAVHSALAPRGINAIHLATDLVQRVRALQSRLEQSGSRDAGYDIPYTTLHVGLINGGVAVNIVPDRCDLELEIRHLPQESPQPLIDAIRAAAAEIAATARRAAAERGEMTAEIRLEPTSEYPGLTTPPDAEIVSLITSLTGERDPIRVAFGTEAGFFSGRLGIPTVVCGPGSITQAHRPDEYVTLDQLARCDRMMDALLERLV